MHDEEGVYRWEFEQGDQALTVSVNGPLIVDDVDLMLRAALDGAGLAFVSEERVASELADGELVRVLEEWCPPSTDTSSTTPRAATNRRPSRP